MMMSSASPSTAGLGAPLPPSGEFLPHIAPPDTMVIDFGVKNRVVALWKSLSKASVQKA